MNENVKGDKLVLFNKYSNVIEANIVKGVLETNGVPCMLANETLSSVLGVTMCDYGMVRLLVFEHDFEKANEIIKSAPNNSCGDTWVRLACDNDRERIWEMLKLAKEKMREMGRNQWQGDYPSYDNVVEDVAAGKGYVLESEEGVCGYTFLTVDGETAYSHLEQGNWITPADTKYVVLHRVVIDPNLWGNGLTYDFWYKLFDIAKCMGCKSCRIDTNYDNEAMLRALTKMGFVYCGKVFYPQSGERMAFEKIL